MLPCVTVREARQILVEYFDLKVRRVFVGDDPYCVLVRPTRGEPFQHPMLYPDSAQLSPRMIESLCRDLRLDVREVMLLLDDPDDDHPRASVLH